MPMAAWLIEMHIKDWCQNQTALRDVRFDVVVIDCNENQIKANSHSHLWVFAPPGNRLLATMGNERKSNFISAGIMQLLCEYLLLFYDMAIVATEAFNPLTYVVHTQHKTDWPSMVEHWCAARIWFKRQAVIVVLFIYFSVKKPIRSLWYVWITTQNPIKPEIWCTNFAP